jgi:hypothetical protein
VDNSGTEHFYARKSASQRPESDHTPGGCTPEWTAAIALRFGPIDYVGELPLKILEKIQRAKEALAAANVIIT